ncbi:bacillithiol biosynthesis deacetylase BshB1 [Evansella cellulosilytica]|uniref:LmbE family protein n=1 Tax=Evansella cellulosilytica (strain ATCC 21833 / DSM 2522 / FERM P-1141 / JCM 9156 / N-4) TaxID=649639 RepID=E6TZI7_EVAC2|nr:bacillithiol biosynthesis deacetylase BshB1 [Evansella cellulosilytica]ADU30161.1 LmbE family protein [Evansella cellulosilytica DSM 2522]
MNFKQLDMLAIGAHPDDVEIGMGGTLAKYASKGFKTAILNLTKAELSSNGTVEGRQLEADKAAKVLQTERIQLSFQDRRLFESKSECILAIVNVIRKYRPKVVFAPNSNDRHPDHGHCSVLVKEAVFSAGIKKFAPDSNFVAYRPNYLYYYQINGMIVPDFVIDISDFIDKKLKALSCYESQFTKGVTGVDTPLTDGYIEKVRGREHLLGSDHGLAYAEGFKSEKPLLMTSLLGE